MNGVGLFRRSRSWRVAGGASGTQPPSPRSGTVAGGLTPGGPYVSLPVAAGLLRAGASVGTMVAFLTGWALWGVSSLPMHVGIMGWRFTLVRIASTFFFPPIAGWLAELLLPLVD